MANYSFDNTIPAANNNPSDDQPNMLINNQSTASIINEDHVGFGQNDGGLHKAIRFSQLASYVPTFPLVAPSFFTDTVAGLAQPKFYSGTVNQSANQYQVSSSFFSTFALGGLIIKGGVFTKSTTSQVVTYSTLPTPLEPFINDTIAVFLQPLTANNTNPALIIAKDAVSFTSSGSVTGVYYFLAIGY